MGFVGECSGDAANQASIQWGMPHRSSDKEDGKTWVQMLLCCVAEQPQLRTGTVPHAKLDIVCPWVPLQAGFFVIAWLLVSQFFSCARPTLDGERLLGQLQLAPLGLEHFLNEDEDRSSTPKHLPGRDPTRAFPKWKDQFLAWSTKLGPDLCRLNSSFSFVYTSACM